MPAYTINIPVKLQFLYEVVLNANSEQEALQLLRKNFDWNAIENALEPHSLYSMEGEFLDDDLSIEED